MQVAAVTVPVALQTLLGFHDTNRRPYGDRIWRYLNIQQVSGYFILNFASMWSV